MRSRSMRSIDTNQEGQQWTGPCRKSLRNLVTPEPAADKVVIHQYSTHKGE